MVNKSTNKVYFMVNKFIIKALSADPNLDLREEIKGDLNLKRIKDLNLKRIGDLNLKEIKGGGKEKQLTAEHGAQTKSEEQGKKFLTYNHALALALLIVTVIVSTFWYDTFRIFFERLFGVDELNWWQFLLIAITLTVGAYYLFVYIFKLPIASIF